MSLTILLSSLSLVCFSSPAVPRIADDGIEERWIEVIEHYELPTDPQWAETAKSVGSKFGQRSEPAGRGSSGKSKGNSVDAVKRPGGLLGGAAGDPLARFRGATGSVQLYEEFLARFEQAGDNDRTRDAINASIEREVDRIVKSAKADRKLVVVRAWDGIKREPVCFVLGARQSALSGKCKAGSVLVVEAASSNCADHAQANGRPTLVEARPRSMPSEFLKFEEGAPELANLGFGLISCPSGWTGTATKSDTVGSGEITVSFELPPSVQLESGLPWFCEFKLMELDSSGMATREVQFTGSSRAVCVSTRSKDGFDGLTGRRDPVRRHAPARWEYRSTASASIEVSAPKPHGYVVVATRVWGVRPHPVPSSPGASTP